MGLFVGGAPVKQVYVGSTPVTAVYVGSEKIWPTGPRVVTISTTRNEWNVGSQSGDVSMIQELTGPRHLVFSAPVTCDQSIRPEGQVTKSAGSRLEAGWVLAPNFYNRTATFTEIL